MDPYQKMFGRRVFEGTGRTSDIFPEAPDLSYLPQRPDFIPDEHDYNPALDPHNLVKSGLPIDLAMQLQGVRQSLHQNSQKDRIRKDAQGALGELKDVDYASPKLNNRLLQIFSKYPNARKSKDVLDQVNFFTKLKPQEESIDVEQIADPILHNKAVKEGWAKLPKAEAQRKIGAYDHNQKILSHAMENGLGVEDLADTLDPEAGVYDPLKVAQKIKLGKYDPTTEVDPRIAHYAISKGLDKMTKPQAAREIAAYKLNLGIEDDAESMGVPAEELAPYKDPETGLYDIGKVKGYLRQYQSSVRPTSGDVMKYTAKAKEERKAQESPEGKLALLQQKYGDPNQTKFSKEDWDWAYEQAKNTKTESEAALEAIMPKKAGAKPSSQAPESSQVASAKPTSLNETSFILPDGSVANFKTAEQAKAFKAKHGL